MIYADVILPIPTGTYTYSVPEELAGQVAPGKRVEVPLGKSKVHIGVIARIHSVNPSATVLKSIRKVLDSEVFITQLQINLWQWMATYYMTPVGEVYRQLVPLFFRAYSAEPQMIIGIKVVDQTLAHPQGLAAAQQALKKCKSQLAALEKLVENLRSDTPLNSSQCSVLSDDDTLEEGDDTLLQSNNTLSQSNDTLLQGNNTLSQSNNALLQSDNTSPSLGNQLSKDDKRLAQGGDLFLPISKSEAVKSLGVSALAISQLCEKGYIEQLKISPYASLAPLKKKIYNHLCSNQLDSSSEKSINFFQANIPLDTLQEELLNSSKESEAELQNPPTNLAEKVMEGLAEKPVVLLHQQDYKIDNKGQFYNSLIQKQKAQGKLTIIIAPDNFAAEKTFNCINNAIDTENLASKYTTILYTGRTSQGKRGDIFFAAAQDQLEVVVGTRIALFLPYKSEKIGLIIVEQEENFAYKQAESSPRYNGRDMAIVIGQMSHAGVLLQSETPSMESYMMAQGGKWSYLTLEPKEPLKEPKFMILDRGKDLVSKYLLRRLEEVTAQGKQAIVFQNRRGFSQYTQCEQCHYTPMCPNCSVSLTFHKNQNALMCHYCGHTKAMVQKCPECGSITLKQSGIGTQRLEEKLQELLPNRKISRLDFDNTRRSGAFQEIAYDFANNKSDILVGTKLMINGLDFSNVALVCIANADIMFSSSDFRGAEHAFALLTQLTNRVSDAQGEVIIQTSQQNNPIIHQVTAHATHLFYDTELKQRQELNYPPSVRMMIISLTSNDIQLLKEAAARCDSMLRPTFGSRLSPFFEPSVYKIAGRYTLQQMLRIERTRSSTKAKEILAANIAALKQRFPHVSIHVDVDPS